MTYEKAIDALIAAGYLKEADRDKAYAALTSIQTEYTYPDWAQALVDAGLIQSMDAATVADYLKQAAFHSDSDDFIQSLENAGIL